MENKFKIGEANNYYYGQLAKVKLDPDFAPYLQIRSGNDDSKTNWISINVESAPVIIEFLTQFISKEEK